MSCRRAPKAVARMEPPGPASGRPDDKLSVIRDRPFPDYVAPSGLRSSIAIVLKGANVGQDGDDLAFREGAAECRHGAGLAIADARDDEIVAALGSCELRPLALCAAAVLMAKAAHGGKQSGAIDVVGRRLGRWQSSGLGGRARTLLRPDAGRPERGCHKHR